MLYVIVSANSNEITFFMLYAVVGILSMMTDSKGIYNRSAQLIHPDGYLISLCSASAIFGNNKSLRS